MNCEFESIYFDREGYVVRCNHCGHYQVAFITTVLTLTENEFGAFCGLVKETMQRVNHPASGSCKAVVLQTPLSGVCIFLAREELNRFCEMLEEAETESRTQALISLFNP